MDYKLPHIFEADGSKGVDNEPLCKCGLNNTYSIHDLELVKEYFPTPPVNESMEKEYEVMQRLKTYFHECAIMRMEPTMVTFYGMLESLLSTARQEERERIDVWVRQMLFDHDGSEGEYKAWIKEWEEFIK